MQLQRSQAYGILSDIATTTPARLIFFHAVVSRPHGQTQSHASDACATPLADRKAGKFRRV